MTTRRQIVGYIFCLAIGGIGAFRLTSPRWSLNDVHPAVSSLKRPYRQVITEYYLDGGSIGILIVDATGATNTFAFPVTPTGQQVYKIFCPGTMWLTRTNILPLIKLDEPTRWYFGRLMDESSRDINRSAALVAFRGAPMDYARVVLPRWANGPSTRDAVTE